MSCHRGCSACCVDGLSVSLVEAEPIRRVHAELLKHGRPHARGACAFLDEDGACRVYAERPNVCRSYGLPQRWVQRHADGSVFEHREICEKNELGGAPVDELSAEECWTMNLVEAQTSERIMLRDLFRHTS